MICSTCKFISLLGKCCRILFASVQEEIMSEFLIAFRNILKRDTCDIPTVEWIFRAIYTLTAPTTDGIGCVFLLKAEHSDPGDVLLESMVLNHLICKSFNFILLLLFFIDKKYSLSFGFLSFDVFC